jgi:hypothetical protein
VADSAIPFARTLAYGQLVALWAFTSARATKRCGLMSDVPLIAFEVNETLLDLETMAPIFGRFPPLVLGLDAAVVAMGKQSRTGEEA